jgi:5'-3' exonuclease
VHNCTHPSDRPAPPDRAAMFEAIFSAVDRLVAAVKPRKLLMLALDGVAPRAKMNQQRSRRFLASRDAADEVKAQAALASAWGAEVPAERFDYNSITPGTQFMHELGDALRTYCASRSEGDPAWSGLVVVLSDASVPGEGEHKIAAFVREQRAMPGYDPDTVHLLYGLDADLVSECRQVGTRAPLFAPALSRAEGASSLPSDYAPAPPLVQCSASPRTRPTSTS